jgi:hypothetical protein
MCGILVCFVTEMEWLTFLDMIQHSDLHVVQMYHGITSPPPHTHTLAFEFNKALMADSGTKLNIFSPGVSWAPKFFFPGS